MLSREGGSDVLVLWVPVHNGKVQRFLHFRGLCNRPPLLRNNADTAPRLQIGTVQVMKSGKVYMKIGSARYLMRPGVEHSHHTELYIINTTTTDMVMVGEDCPTASACLDLEALLLSES